MKNLVDLVKEMMINEMMKEEENDKRFEDMEEKVNKIKSSSKLCII